MDKARFLWPILAAGLMAPASPAGAQQPVPPAASGAEAPAKAAGEQPVRFLEEVEVTAEKKKESVNEIGATVTAYSGEDLRALDVETPTQIDRLSPNTDFKTSGQGVNPAITIRGVGINNFNSNNNPSVGIYVDEVHLSSPAMLSLFMMDLERVELLKGPQGTLYGRNANGGAINILSTPPSSKRQAFAELSGGSHGNLKFEGALGGGLSDTVSARVSGLYEGQADSFFENTLTGQSLGDFKQYGARAQLAFQRGRFEANLNGFTLSQDGVSGIKEIFGTQDAGDPSLPCGPAGQASGAGFDLTRLDRTRCVSALGTVDSHPDFFESDIDPALVNRLHIDTELSGGILTARYGTERARVTSITGYLSQDRRYGEGSHIEGGMFLAEHGEELTQLSQELRLDGTAGRVSWVGGLFYAKDEIQAFNPLESPGVFGAFFGLNPLYWDYDQTQTSFAAFGSVDLRVAEKVTLVGGLRFTDEKVDFRGGTTALEEGGPYRTTTDLLNASRADLDAIGIPLTGVTDSIEDDNVSGRLALEVRPAKGLLVYGSFATGFKSGGFFGDFTLDNAELAPFKPETLHAFELGLKAGSPAGRYQLSAALFAYDYDDIQTFVPSTIGFKFDNVEHADILGGDAELVARPATGLTLLLGGGFLDTKLKSQFANLDGNQLPNAPRFQLTGIARYMWHFSHGLWLTPQVSFKHTAGKFTEATNDPLNYVSSYTVVDARLSLMPSSTKWEIALWAHNLGDTRYLQEAFRAEVLGTVDGVVGAPRALGASVTVNLHATK